MIKLHTWLPNLVEAFTFYGGGKGGGESSGTSVSTIDPMIKPYVTYGLSQAQRLYKSATPQYFPGQTYVSPSEETQTALNLAKTRSIAGSPLLRTAQQETLSTMQNRDVNPYLASALRAGYAPTVEAAQEGLRGIQSNASAAGRYGSDAMTQLAERTASKFSRGMAETLSNLALASSENEANRRMNAINLAPSLSQADYQDIQNLMNVGQTREDYAKTALQSDIDRFNFQQNLPYQKLATFLSSVYGAPQGQVTQTEQQQSSGKIVCTAMNYAYGFGSFRQTIWLKHSATMHPAYEVGYHTLFLNAVMWAFDKKPGKLRKVVRNVLEHVARHRTADIWKQRRGKRDTLGMIYRAILEPICYVVGKVKGA